MRQHSAEQTIEYRLREVSGVGSRNELHFVTPAYAKRDKQAAEICFFIYHYAYRFTQKTTHLLSNFDDFRRYALEFRIALNYRGVMEESLSSNPPAWGLSFRTVSTVLSLN